MNRLNIGEAAAAAGATPKMVRHYESLGLVPEPERTEAGYRLYGATQVAQLRFIRQCRGLGFSMAQTAALVRLWTDEGRHSREVKDVARQQLRELEERQRELEQMRQTLAGLVAGCAGDDGAHCAILQGLESASVQAAAPAGKQAALKRPRPASRGAGRSPRARPAAEPLPHPAHALMAWSHAAARA